MPHSSPSDEDEDNEFYDAQSDQSHTETQNFILKIPKGHRRTLSSGSLGSQVCPKSTLSLQTAACPTRSASSSASPVVGARCSPLSPTLPASSTGTPLPAPRSAEGARRSSLTRLKSFLEGSGERSSRKVRALLRTESSSIEGAGRPQEEAPTRKHRRNLSDGYKIESTPQAQVPPEGPTSWKDSPRRQASADSPAKSKPKARRKKDT